MKKTISPCTDRAVLHLSTNIIYGLRREWNQIAHRPLSISLLRTRRNAEMVFEKQPVLLFLTGGGFVETDPSIWMPELTWYARHGYAVASIEYTITPLVRFPTQLQEIKQAIRFLRAHADEYGLDTDRMFVMGESAGGYLSTLVGLESGNRLYDVGEYLDQSSEVTGVISYYPITQPDKWHINLEYLVPPREFENYPDLTTLVTEKTPPTMILHGVTDEVVEYYHSTALYEALCEKNVPVEFISIPDGLHASNHFWQDEIKEEILKFMEQHG